MAIGKETEMKTVLATLAAVGLMTSFAYAGCAGHSASKEKSDQLAEAPITTPAPKPVVAN